MPLPALDAPFTDADIRAAQTVLDAWTENPAVVVGATVDELIDDAALLVLRGIVAQVVSDARYAGYVEGIQQGRKQIGRLVHDALTDEGL